jgi:plasmid maintenance system antidote protein VapI
VSPDDPRHGTYAGAAQHDREQTPRCVPCVIAYRAYKRRWQHTRALGYDLIVPVGELGYAVVIYLVDEMGLSDRDLAEVTGLSGRNLHRIAADGSQTRVRRRVRDQLQHVDVGAVWSLLLTHDGCVRRVRALTRIGYSAQHVAALAGVDRGSVKAIQTGQTAHTRHTVRIRIAAAYDAAQMRPLPWSNITARAYRLAELHGWPAPMAWDPETIDDPKAQPSANPPIGDYGYVDTVAVERRLDGDRSIRLTTPEARELVRRGHVRGLTGSEIARRTGLKVERYRAEPVSASA